MLVNIPERRRTARLNIQREKSQVALFLQGNSRISLICDPLRIDGMGR